MLALEPGQRAQTSTTLNGRGLSNGDVYPLDTRQAATVFPRPDGDEEESDDEQLDAGEEYTRRRKKKVMSSLSRLFISAAVFHACAVITFQSAVLGLADFSLICNGGLGVDRKIYAILFISAMAYVIVLVIWALYSENIIEVYAFGVIQILSIVYSATQIFQFYEAKNEYRNMPGATDSKLRVYDPPIILAVSNMILSVVMTIFYIYGTYHLYIEFGWKIYTTVPFKAEAKLRGAFSTYQVFTCFLKLELFFTEMFLLSHVTLLLRDNTQDPEFIGSIIAMVLAIVVTILVVVAVRHENKFIMFSFLLVLLALVGYYSFKMFRFITKSCALCKQVQNEMCVVPVSLPGATATNTEPSPQNLRFEHLTLFAAIVDITTVLLFLVSLNYMSKFGSGLTKIFKELELFTNNFRSSTPPATLVNPYLYPSSTALPMEALPRKTRDAADRRSNSCHDDHKAGASPVQIFIDGEGESQVEHQL